MRLSHGYLPVRGKPLAESVVGSLARRWRHLLLSASGGAGAQKKNGASSAAVLSRAGRDPEGVALASGRPIRYHQGPSIPRS